MARHVTIDPAASDEPSNQFTSKTSTEIRRRLSSTISDGSQKPRWGWASLTPMYAGLAANVVNEGHAIQLGFSINDGAYSMDYSIQTIQVNGPVNGPSHAKNIEDHIVRQLVMFSNEHLLKFVGAGVTEHLAVLAPNLCTRLWKELDMVPIVFHVRTTTRDSPRPGLSRQASPARQASPGPEKVSGTQTPNTSSGLFVKPPAIRSADEQADSAVRKCVMYFGPNHNPRLTIGFPHNRVEVDADHRIRILDGLEEYRASVREPTWNAVNKYAQLLREKGVKIGFFSSTPQGGGVALMRHALIRFLNIMGVDAAWYVPKPSPAVFRTTKNNHNILQGVADPNLRMTKAQADQFTQWIVSNAERYWLCEGGPLAHGGVDVAFIDDPQMPGLIPLIKKARPDLPIIYRSHIEIRSDLIHQQGSPQSEVWEYLWDRIKLADLFIAHPVAKFVPDDVPLEKLALMPAATDWLDGLSKHMSNWDLQYYMRLFSTQCTSIGMNTLDWPNRDYIVQVARFDPAKGIPQVIDSYYKLRVKLDEEGKSAGGQAPQLLLCGHSAIDDPDATIIYDQTMQLLEREDYKKYAHDVVVMRIPPSDQLLNALISNAKLAVQLSTREGFEVKVSEALHKGIPIVATLAGGIPLQVQHEKNGFLVPVGDTDAVAKHLYDLWTDDDLYETMSDHAKVSVSDEVSTLGNAASWLYLAYKFSSGEKLKPNGKWINDMMREEAGEPYREGEPRLPRKDLNIQG